MLFISVLGSGLWICALEGMWWSWPWRGGLGLWLMGFKRREGRPCGTGICYWYSGNIDCQWAGSMGKGGIGILTCSITGHRISLIKSCEFHCYIHCSRQTFIPPFLSILHLCRLPHWCHLRLALHHQDHQCPPNYLLSSHPPFPVGGIRPIPETILHLALAHQ